MSMKNIITTLEERGFIEAQTSHEIKEIVHKPLTLYGGFDPTADSLHLGNLVGIMFLAWFHKFGHNPIALVGGATGMIGDPSGRSLERNLLDAETLQHNLKGIGKSLKAVLKTDIPIVNNFDWFQGITFIDFLRDVGKHFRLSSMLAKESVKTRLNSEEGISLTEFSYQLLQAYDFLHLYDTHNVICQVGGSDQWGNITAGCELVRRTRNATVYGLTWPLLVRSDGKKFGKSEEGAIWLNADKLPPYDFYQYLFRMPDADISKALRMLTFLEMDEIREIEASMKSSQYVANTAQKKLAEEVTRIVHGEEGLKEALSITEAARPGSKAQLDKATMEHLLSEIPSCILTRSAVVGAKLVDLLVSSQAIGSKGEARRMIANGGVYLNNEKIGDENFCVDAKHLIEDEFLLLGIGKKKKLVCQIK